MVAAVADRARRCPERHRGAARRRRLRPVRLLRLRHRDAVLRSGGGARSPVRQLPHHGAVLADACVPDHRPQRPLERDGARGGAGCGLPGLQRHHPQRERLPVRDPGSQRVLHLRRGEVAPDTGHRDDDGEPPRQVAARSGLRAVLRLHGRGDRPVPARPGVRQPHHRSPSISRGGLPPHRGPGRQGDPVPTRPPRHCPDQTVLLVVRPRRLSRPAPGTTGLHRPLPRPVRPGLG